MRPARAVAVAAAILLVGAPAAAAHEGNPNFRSEITSIAPETDGLDVEVLNFDDSLRLTNRSGEDVVITGYEDEPYARIAADGTVEVNRNSTAYYLNDDRYADAEVPEGIDPSDPPDWERVDGSGSLTWHDHRMHWMSTSTPPQVEDESEEAKVFDYSIPIEVGGERGAIEGTLTWVGQDSGFPAAPFIGLGVVALAGAGFVALRRRRDRPAPAPRTDDTGGW
jgi:LPXTG-motif cell wall-anchored protein